MIPTIRNLWTMTPDSGDAGFGLQIVFVELKVGNLYQIIMHDSVYGSIDILEHR